MRIELNEIGVIIAIGYVIGYAYECPEFIGFDNFTEWKCNNRDEILKIESWEEIAQ